MASLKSFLARRRALCWILALGLLLRIAALAALARFPLVSDAASYHAVALQLSRGEPATTYWPPALPYYLFFVYSFLGPSQISGRASMLFFYLVLSALLYFVIEPVSGRLPAALAVLAFSLYPTFVHQSVETLSQLPAAALLLAAIYLLMRIGRAPSTPAACGLGLVLGCLVLLRPSTLPFIAAAPMFLALRAKKVRLACIGILVSSGIVGAWIVKAHRMTGRLVLINDANAKNLFIGNNPYTPLYKTWWLGSHVRGPGVPALYRAMLREIVRKPQEMHDGLYRQAVMAHIRSRPDLFLIRTLSRIRNYFAFDTFTGSELIQDYHCNKLFGLSVIAIDGLFFSAVMVCAVLSMFVPPDAAPARESYFLALGAALLYGLPYWLSYAHPTYHLPVLPLFAVLAASFFGRLLQEPIRVRLRFRRNRCRYFALAALGLFACTQLEWLLVMRSRI